MMRRVPGYFISYPDARAIMENLRIPDKGLDDIKLGPPINDWLAKKKYRTIVCTTVGNIYSKYKEAECVFLIKTVYSLEIDTLVERDWDKYVKKCLVEEGGAREDSVRWMSFPDGDELNLFVDGTRPRRNSLKGPWIHYRLTKDQKLRMKRSRKKRDDC